MSEAKGSTWCAVLFQSGPGRLFSLGGRLSCYSQSRGSARTYCEFLLAFHYPEWSTSPLPVLPASPQPLSLTPLGRRKFLSFQSIFFPCVYNNAYHICEHEFSEKDFRGETLFQGIVYKLRRTAFDAVKPPIPENKRKVCFLQRKFLPRFPLRFTYVLEGFRLAEF